MKDRFNLLFPEWQGYSDHQEVYHGAYHFCEHLAPNLLFEAVDVRERESLSLEEGIIGRASLLRMLGEASTLLNKVNPSQVFMVGGTCACEMAPIGFLNKKYDNDLAVFWFDAHGDLNTPASSPSHHLHGMPLRSLLGEGDPKILETIPRFLESTQVALVGARDLDEGEQQYIEQYRVPIFKPTQQTHASELVDFAKSAGFTKAYIHLDLDALEPSEFAHTLWQVSDGLRISDTIASMQAIRQQFEVVGCSVVEYCPKDRTASEQLFPLVTSGLGISL